MSLSLVAWLSGGALFLALIGMQVLGCRTAARRIEPTPRVAAVEGAIFALLGLLIAFTFSGASNRFDDRRSLIVAETNAIGTAWLRLDLLPEPSQPALRALLRDYLDARIEGHQRLPDVAAARASFARATHLQGELWAGARAACAEQHSALVLLLPALNDAFDAATARVAALSVHPPAIIYGLLVLLCLACAFLAGYAAGKDGPSWIYVLAFAAVLTLTVYVIVDLELPRAGLIRVEHMDQLLIDLRRSFDGR